MATDAEIKESLMLRHETVRVQERIANYFLRGKKVRILSDYNGQPYGTSKKSLKGTIQLATGGSLYGSDVALFLDGHAAGIFMSEVEFVSDHPATGGKRG